LKITTVYVTHDQTEAMNMSDRIVVMNTGRIEQMGSAEDIYNHPKTRFVADFVGQINLLQATIVDREDDYVNLMTAGNLVRVRDGGAMVSGEVSIAVRPEQLQLIQSHDTTDGLNVLSGTLVGRTFAGNITRVFVDVGLDKPVVVESRPNDAPREIGVGVRIGWSPSNAAILAE
jgi:ABC-type Fe3+/spermidine/putrescine transport system ATPase subunit